MTTTDLQGVSRTLLIPLACRAYESARPDALLHDPRAAEKARTQHHLDKGVLRD